MVGTRRFGTRRFGTRLFRSGRWRIKLRRRPLEYVARPIFGSNLLHSRVSEPGKSHHERPVFCYMRIAAEAGLAPDIFVLNRGMHYRDDGAVLEEIAGVLKHVAVAAPAALVFWRVNTRTAAPAARHSRRPSPLLRCSATAHWLG